MLGSIIECFITIQAPKVNSATLRVFSWAEPCHTQNFYLKNEDDIKNEDDKKNEDNQKNEDKLILRTYSKKKTTQKMSTASKVLPEKNVDDFSP